VGINWGDGGGMQGITNGLGAGSTISLSHTYPITTSWPSGNMTYSGKIECTVQNADVNVGTTFTPGDFPFTVTVTTTLYNPYGLGGHPAIPM
jgi:hypothetical protein